jgi:hypothetical protein
MMAALTSRHPEVGGANEELGTYDPEEQRQAVKNPIGDDDRK